VIFLELRVPLLRAGEQEIDPRVCGLKSVESIAPLGQRLEELALPPFRHALSEPLP
jgi:hypothetical protein